MGAGAGFSGGASAAEWVGAAVFVVEAHAVAHFMEQSGGGAVNRSGEALRTAGAADVGVAGSGVIGLSLAQAWPEADVTLADISSDALQLAGANAAKHGREVRLVQTDLWAALPAERFSLVIANLPYIPSGEIAQLEV